MQEGRRLFGTDGVRGVANREPITAPTALRLGMATVRVFRRDSRRRPRLLIGKDTRISGDMLETALASGAASMGADVWLAGVLPTPAIALLTRSLEANAGVVISASHNPFSDNGIKLFGPDGFKLPDELEAEIETVLREEPAGLAIGAELGRVSPLEDARRRYVTSLLATVPATTRFDSLKIVIDGAHGAGANIAPEVFAALGARVSTLGCDPNGININDGVGAVHPDGLAQAVRAQGADLGLALDGDADRAILVDETGEVVDGDEILALVAIDKQARGELRGGAIVATVMSNLGLEIALREHGIGLHRTAVGDRYVVEEMRRSGCDLGGEQSGHLIFLDSSTTGDGILAGLQVARRMVERGLPLSRLKGMMRKLPQVLVNVRVKARQDLREVPAVQTAIDAVTRSLNERGRVLVRYSGTEPLVRVMVEGEDQERVTQHAERIANTIRESVGA